MEPNVFNQCPIDIFRVERQGVIWLESAPTLEDAQARIEEFGIRQSGDFLVLNQVTGNIFMFNTDLASAASAR
jgi:hypothetical protein